CPLNGSPSFCLMFTRRRGVEISAVAEGRFGRLDSWVRNAYSLRKNLRFCLTYLCYDSAPVIRAKGPDYPWIGTAPVHVREEASTASGLRVALTSIARRECPMSIHHTRPFSRR